jgi:hypothetical protein
MKKDLYISSRDRGYTNRIPLVLVNVYFYRGLSENKPKEVHMSNLHREKHTYVYKRRL